MDIGLEKAKSTYLIFEQFLRVLSKGRISRVVTLIVATYFLPLLLLGGIAYLNYASHLRSLTEVSHNKLAFENVHLGATLDTIDVCINSAEIGDDLSEFNCSRALEVYRVISDGWHSDSRDILMEKRAFDLMKVEVRSRIKINEINMYKNYLIFKERDLLNFIYSVTGILLILIICIAPPVYVLYRFKKFHEENKYSNEV